MSPHCCVRAAHAPQGPPAGARALERAQAAGIETIDVEDTNWTADTRGAPGEEVSLHLLLRMVADIGIVGLPNAGKSSLLACLTRSVPDPGGTAPWRRST